MKIRFHTGTKILGGGKVENLIQKHTFLKKIRQSQKLFHHVIMLSLLGKKFK